MNRNILLDKLNYYQRRSQGSLLPALRNERERERPCKTLVTWLQNKINSEEESFVSHFFVWFIRSDRNSKIDLPTLLQL